MNAKDRWNLEAPCTKKKKKVKALDKKQSGTSSTYWVGGRAGKCYKRMKLPIQSVCRKGKRKKYVEHKSRRSK